MNFIFKRDLVDGLQIAHHEFRKLAKSLSISSRTFETGQISSTERTLDSFGNLKKGSKERNFAKFMPVSEGSCVHKCIRIDLGVQSIITNS